MILGVAPGGFVAPPAVARARSLTAGAAECERHSAVVAAPHLRQRHL